MLRSRAAPRTPTPAGILLLTVACAVAGCLRSPPLDLSADPAELLAAVRARQDRVLRVAGPARLRFDTPGLKGSVEALVAAERPGRARIEALDFFGNTAAYLVVADGRYLFVDARRGTFTRGEATREATAALLPLPISPEELATALCGSAPVLGLPPLEASAGRGVMHLTLAGGDLVQRLEVGAGAVVERSTVRRRGPGGEQPAGPAFTFAIFRDLGGVPFPMQLRLDAAAPDARLDLEWRKDLVVNGDPLPALFDLTPPPGLRPAEGGPGARSPGFDLPVLPAE